ERCRRSAILDTGSTCTAQAGQLRGDLDDAEGAVEDKAENAVHGMLPFIPNGSRQPAGAGYQNDQFKLIPKVEYAVGNPCCLYKVTSTMPSQDTARQLPRSLNAMPVRRSLIK